MHAFLYKHLLHLLCACVCVCAFVRACLLISLRPHAIQLADVYCVSWGKLIQITPSRDQGCVHTWAYFVHVYVVCVCFCVCFFLVKCLRVPFVFHSSSTCSWREGTGIGPRVTRGAAIAVTSPTVTITSSQTAKKAPVYGASVLQEGGNAGDAVMGDGDDDVIDERAYDEQFARARGFTFAPKNTQVCTYTWYYINKNQNKIKKTNAHAYTYTYCM